LEQFQQNGLIAFTARDIVTHPGEEKCLPGRPCYTNPVHTWITTINPTPATQKYLKQVDANKQVLEIPAPKYTFDRVVKSEKMEAETSQLQVVMGTYSSTATQEYRAYIRATGGRDAGMSNKNKFIALFSYDVFKEVWKMIAWDLADQDTEFLTDNVDSWLRQHGAARQR
jgi:hypothetical protein